MTLLKRTIRILILLVLAAKAVSYGASKEIVQLQRDVALRQYDLRSLQHSPTRVSAEHELSPGRPSTG